MPTENLNLFRKIGLLEIRKKYSASIGMLIIKEKKKRSHKHDVVILHGKPYI